MARNTSFACDNIVPMRIADVQEDIDYELISSEEIHTIIAKAAAQVSKDYQGKNPLLVAVLKGAINTLAAFSQELSIPCQLDFMSLSSYGSGTTSTGTITVRQDLSTDVRGRHILIVEDIVDSGRTLAWLVEELKRRGAASVEIFALLESRHVARSTWTSSTRARRSPTSSSSDSDSTTTSDTAISTPSRC